jgi:hypothetical protein
MAKTRKKPAAPKRISPERPVRVIPDILIPGFVVGNLGGAVMAVLAVAYCAIFAGDPLLPLKMVATVFYRDHHYADLGGGAAALGLALHMGVATGVATAFAATLPRRGESPGVAALGYAWLLSLGLYVVMEELVVPFAAPEMYRWLRPLPFFALHLAFGACLPVVVVVRKLLSKVLRFGERVELLLEEKPVHN